MKPPHSLIPAKAGTQVFFVHAAHLKRSTTELTKATTFVGNAERRQ